MGDPKQMLVLKPLLHSLVNGHILYQSSNSEPELKLSPVRLSTLLLSSNHSYLLISAATYIHERKGPFYWDIKFSIMEIFYQTERWNIKNLMS